MISERTLRQWRKDSLIKPKLLETTLLNDQSIIVTANKIIEELNERILRLTQDLMDLHLMQKGR